MAVMPMQLCLTKRAGAQTIPRHQLSRSVNVVMLVLGIHRSFVEATMSTDILLWTKHRLGRKVAQVRLPLQRNQAHRLVIGLFLSITYFVCSPRFRHPPDHESSYSFQVLTIYIQQVTVTVSGQPVTVTTTPS